MKICVFFHTRLSGGVNVDSGASIDPVWGRKLFTQQMSALMQSGLYSAADEIYIGLNGDGVDYAVADGIAPKGCKILLHGPDAASLLPTMQFLQGWLPIHEDWLVCFHHGKGATKPNDPMTTAWRNCMTKYVITNWRQCVADLESGQFDAVGCHWTHNSPNDQNAHDWGANSYFAGVFWWSTARYLLTLPKLPEKPHNRHQWFKPELWLGNGKPRIRDYHSGPVTNH